MGRSVFKKKLVSLSRIIAGVFTCSDGAAGTSFGDGSAAGVSCGACCFASLSDAACSAGGSLEVCFANDRVIGAMAARRIQRVLQTPWVDGSGPVAGACRLSVRRGLSTSDCCMVGNDVAFSCVSNKVIKAKMGGFYTTFEYAIYQHFNEYGDSRRDLE